jgi:hypothetical protein
MFYLTTTKKNEGRKREERKEKTDKGHDGFTFVLAW